MNFARNAILTTVIFQMVYSTFPLTAARAIASETSAERTSSISKDLFVQHVMHQEKDLIKAKCLKPVKGSGKDPITYEVDNTVIIDQKGLSDDSSKAQSCVAAVENFLPAQKAAEEIMNEKPGSEDCVDCKTAPANSLNFENAETLEASTTAMLADGNTCSKDDRAKIAKEKCDLGCGFKNAMVATANHSALGLLWTKGSLGEMAFGEKKVNTSPNCPIPQGTELECWGSIAKTFLLSMTQLTTAAYNGIKALAQKSSDWAGGLFSAHEQAQSHATSMMQFFANATDKEADEANIDKGKTLFEKIKYRFGQLFDLLVIDRHEFAVEFECYHCKDKLKPACKAIGLLGRDLVLMYLGGKVITAASPLLKKMALKMAKGASAGAKSVFKGAEKVAAKNAVSKRLFTKGVNAIGRVSEKTAAEWAEFKGGKIVYSKNTFKKVAGLPPRIAIGARKGFVDVTERLGSRAKRFGEALGMTKEESTIARPLNEAVEKANRVIVATEASAQEDAVSKAKRSLEKLRLVTTEKGAKKVKFVSKSNIPIQDELRNIDNSTSWATQSSMEEDGHIYVSASDGGREIFKVQVPKGKIPSTALTFEPEFRMVDRKYVPIIRYTDGSATIHSPNGLIQVPATAEKALNAAMNLESDAALKKEISGNITNAEMKATEVEGGTKVEGNAACGETLIEGSVVKAI